MDEYFQGYFEERIDAETKQFKRFVNDLPIIVKISNKIDTCFINADIVYPFYAVVKCEKYTVIENSKNQYQILNPKYPFFIRVIVFGPSKVVMPLIQNITISDHDNHWYNLKPNTVTLREITVLENLNFTVQIIKDGYKRKYFIKNPHENVWINGCKGDYAAEFFEQKIRLEFIYSKDKKQWDTNKHREECIGTSLGILGIIFAFAYAIFLLFNLPTFPNSAADR